MRVGLIWVRLMTKQLRIGLAGLGTVGASLVRLLQMHGAAIGARAGRPMAITAVSARDRKRDRGIDLSGLAWFDDAVALAGSADIDCFVELIGGDEGPAREAVEAALKTGKHVVTANKALLAKHGNALAALAEENGVHLAFEASAAGGIPIVKTMREALAGNRVTRLYGILNGTCNYILSRMEAEGLSFAECLADAQRLGYAEARLPTIGKRYLLALSPESRPGRSSARAPRPIARFSLMRMRSMFAGEFYGHRPARSEMGRMYLGFRHQACSASARRTRTGIEQRVIRRGAQGNFLPSRRSWASPTPVHHRCRCGGRPHLMGPVAGW